MEEETVAEVVVMEEETAVLPLEMVAEMVEHRQVMEEETAELPLAMEAHPLAMEVLRQLMFSACVTTPEGITVP